MTALTTWIMGTFFRWFPHRESPGLRAVGNPDGTSPVLVTCNYRLTVSRLLKNLKGLDLWLLVAPSDGINVWCAACGGSFTDHQVISTIKTSLLADKVKHRTLILPPLSAPAMDCQRIRKETGFHVRFGPVRSQDIPAYMASGKKKTEAMMRAAFGLKHRLDMLVSMNFVIWLLVAILFVIFWPGNAAHMTILFWCLALVLYLSFPWLPGRNGWSKALAVGTLVVGAYLAAGWVSAGSTLAYWPWMIGAIGLAFAIGFDLAGIAAPVPSDAEALAERVGLKSLGFLLSEKPLGVITLDRESCKGCQNCNDLCPVGVYDFDLEARKTVLARREDCFSCRACVKQCPENALALAAAG